ncbi:hypothetical protein F1737_03060 [Methanoplanus sp. FWC-SCC4]|uniref:DNA-(apurinic or apyrimidinic site) lyase n=1 Tax=Methanochimaera problematica TaxID=2609417 RepID=A0AA97FE17_9EURY|nr:DNA glycosylase [Methanoplanus sp. FWC-SCC4]WOF15741.1 hypothetical protein F1737_03060 [Methanoplanus sp. FWC-SCC4]
MAKHTTIELNDDQPFNLDLTLSCGQAPRWYKGNGWWYGIVRDSVLKIKQDENKILFIGSDEEFIRDYFCLDFDLDPVYSKLKQDPYAKDACDFGKGLRLVNQDPWECMIFQMTVNRIRTKSRCDRITRISDKIGKKIIFEGKEYSIFPRPKEITDAGLSALKSCNIGYFADNILFAAEKVGDNPDWEEKIKKMSYQNAVFYLTSFKGIKYRVAEWILLFSFQKYEAFPVDAHIREIFIKNYLKGHYFGKLNDEKVDDAIRDIARVNFGQYAGYALEYLFNYEIIQNSGNR